MSKDNPSKEIAARCPICQAILPIFTVTAKRHGFLGRHVRLTLEGDATDYVAHLWSHERQGAAWR
jgi:hypothetical protein